MAKEHYVVSRALGIRAPVGTNEHILREVCPIDGALLVNYIDSVEVTHDNHCKICKASYPDLSEQGLQETAEEYVESLQHKLVELDDEKSKLIDILNVAKERGL